MPVNTLDSSEHFHARRQTLKLMMLGTGALVASNIFQGCASDGSNIFPQSVASGDPRPDSVVLWTRVEDSSTARDKDLDVVLEVATDEHFTHTVLSRNLTAYAVYSHAIKVRIEDLEPYTYYYYRFRYKNTYSVTGRTKTAPAADSDKKIKFSYISCQDYIGRYYNVYAHMLKQDDLDFIVHLGDYIYETNGEPLTQVNTPDRQIYFRDIEGAIHLGGYEAACSSDNYRQLYQTYRSDPMLQKIHERFPMIAIWDDHEFSDDDYDHGHANYFGDQEDEYEKVRFKNSQRVYLEYMPLDVGLDSEGVLSPQSEVWLDDENEVIIYRDFQFGANVHLIMTDYRSYRPDHLVREDAFPGTVFADKTELIDFFGSDFYEDNLEIFGAYFDVDTYKDGLYVKPLRHIASVMYEHKGLDKNSAKAYAEKAIQGKLNLRFANEMISGYNEKVPALLSYPLLFSTESEMERFDKGLAYVNGGKVDLFSATGIGSRYMVIKKVFDIYSQLKQAAGEIYNVYGATQQNWIDNTLSSSSAKWRIYASSVSMAPMLIDLKKVEGLDPILQENFYMNLDQFDGFPFQRQTLMNQLRAQPSIVISGDIHSSFVTDHHQVVEFTGSSVTSSTFEEVLTNFVEKSDVAKQFDGLTEIVSSLNMPKIVLDSNATERETDPNYPVINTVDTRHNAYVVLEVDSDGVQTHYYSIAAKKSKTNLYRDPKLNSHFTCVSYHVDRGTMKLKRA